MQNLRRLKMENLKLETKDNIKIEINYFKGGFDSVIVIAPGWCMTKDSKAFFEMEKEFSKEFDIISLDFRGHGRSKGFYTFGAKEEKDLDAVFDFIKNKNYKNVYLMGFSLGGMVSILYAAKNKIDKLVVVSAPCDFNKIENKMYKKEAWLETFKKFELKRFLSIRPSIIPHKKEKPIDYIDKINIPVLFITGKKDPTVYFWHTEELYKKAKCKKELFIYEKGIHAEDLFLYDKKGFIQKCTNWLKN